MDVLYTEVFRVIIIIAFGFLCLTVQMWRENNRSRARNVLRISREEVRTGCTRVDEAEKLILQLPEQHTKRNAWLAKYGTSDGARKYQCGLHWDTDQNCTFHPAD